MIYPTISTYISALESPKGVFRTLKRVSLVRDASGEPIYRSGRGYVRVAVKVGADEHSLRLFTRAKVHKQYEGVLRGELLVAGIGEADYYDVVLEDSFVERGETPKNEDIGVLSENLRAVGRDGKWGFEDQYGELIIAAEYDRVEDFSESRAVVELEGYHGLIDTTGRRVIEPIYDELGYDGSHLCYVEREGLCGVIDRRGRVVVEPEWDWIGEFSQGLAVVQRDGKYGYVDMNGRVAIDVIYDDAIPFDTNEYATVTRGGVRYNIDKDQNRV